MTFLKGVPVSFKLRNSRRFQNQLPVFHKCIIFLLDTLIVIIKPYPEMLFSMTKYILINMPAANKSDDSFRRLICKDVINRIRKGKFSIGDNDTRERNILSLQKLPNMGDYPSVRRLAVVKIAVAMRILMVCLH